MGENMKAVQMTLEEDLVAAVDRVARRLKTTRSAFARDALRVALARYRARNSNGSTVPATGSIRSIAGSSTFGKPSTVGRRMNRGAFSVRQAGANAARLFHSWRK